MNFYTMVMGQANTGREVIGTTATVVPDNKKYAVTEVKDDAIVLTEVLPDDAAEDVVADVVEITEANAAIAHYGENPNGRAVIADAVLSDGKLSFAKTEISTGTLPLKKILGAVEGFILFTADSDVAADGQVTLYSYDIQNDKFAEVDDMIVPEDVEFKAIEGVGNFLIINDVRTVDIKNDNGDVVGQADVAFNCRVLTVSGGSNLYIEEGLELDCPTEDIRKVSQGDRDFTILVTTKKTDENGYLVPAEKAMIRIYKYGIADKIATIFVNDPAAEVVIGGANSEVTTVFDGDTMLIKNSRGLVVVNDKAVATEMADFKYFCGVAGSKSDRGENITTWTFANDKREVKSFTQTMTDRGIIFKMA